MIFAKKLFYRSIHCLQVIFVELILAVICNTGLTWIWYGKSDFCEVIAINIQF